MLCFGSNRTKTQHIITYLISYLRYVGLRISSGTGTKNCFISRILFLINMKELWKLCYYWHLRELYQKDAEDFKDKDFNYRQVIGKLLYLEKSTRPDIACAVHQCARYCNAPKVSHAQAVKRICRYLLGTRDKGLIFDPKEDCFDCWEQLFALMRDYFPHWKD